jgi:hypothetical protein
MEAGITDGLFTYDELVGIVDEWEASQKDKRIMKPLHAATLVLGVMLSSCGYIEWGPTAGDLHLSELEYQKCLRTSEYTSECANERQVRNFSYQFAFHSEVSCQPGARTPAKLE